MVRRLAYEPVAVGLQMLAIHSLIPGPWNCLPEMPDHRINEKQVSILIPVVPPRIRCPMTHDLKNPSSGMIPPNRAVQIRSRVFRRARFADRRSGHDAMPPIKPAIWPP